MTAVSTYTQVDGLRIAYEVRGSGPPLVIAGTSFTNQEALLDDPEAAMFINSLARFSTLIRFDVIGVGGSDRAPADRVLPTIPDQILAVMNSAGVERATIMAILQGGPDAIDFVVTQPERVEGLILWNTTARFVRDDDYDIGVDPEVYDQISQALIQQWGTEGIAKMNLPSRAGDQRFIDWYVRYVRSSASPGQVEANMRMAKERDVRDLLPLVEAPTLVMARSDHIAIPASHGRYVADHVPGARYIEFPGSDGPLYWETPELIVEAIEQFMTGTVATVHARPETLSMLFTDIVGSTELAGRYGDARWSVLLSQHDEAAYKWVELGRGRIIKHTGDGIFAVFPSPSPALRAADSMRNAFGGLGLDVRFGLHAAEVEARGDDFEGLGVVVARRVMEVATGGEILVSRTICDLLEGSRLVFEDAGVHRLKGLERDWHLYRYAG